MGEIGAAFIRQTTSAIKQASKMVQKDLIFVSREAKTGFDMQRVASVVTPQKNQNLID